MNYQTLAEKLRKDGLSDSAIVKELKRAGLKVSTVDSLKLKWQNGRMVIPRQRHEKSGTRAYFTPAELGELVGRSAETIREMFRHEQDGIKKKTTSGRNRKPYTTMMISRTAAKRRFPDLEI